MTNVVDFLLLLRIVRDALADWEGRRSEGKGWDKEGG